MNRSSRFGAARFEPAAAGLCSNSSSSSRMMTAEESLALAFVAIAFASIVMIDVSMVPRIPSSAAAEPSSFALARPSKHSGCAPAGFNPDKSLSAQASSSTDLAMGSSLLQSFSGAATSAGAATTEDSAEAPAGTLVRSARGLDADNFIGLAITSAIPLTGVVVALALAAN